MAEPEPDSFETERMLQQLGTGNEQAFDQLFGKHRSALRRFVALRLDPRLRPRVDPSDVVQETQLEAFRRLPDYLERRPMPFRLWLRKTAYERLLKTHRHHAETARRSVAREVALPDDSSLLLGQQLQATGPSPSEQLAQRELIRRVRQAVSRLPDMDREILFMRYFEEQSYHDLSCVLEIDPAAARKRYGRALLRLRELLYESGLPESDP
jgi:RNA polymerase sigma-70 factor (ECF subfamily)